MLPSTHSRSLLSVLSTFPIPITPRVFLLAYFCNSTPPLLQNELRRAIILLTIP